MWVFSQWTTRAGSRVDPPVRRLPRPRLGGGGVVPQPRAPAGGRAAGEPAPRRRVARRPAAAPRRIQLRRPRPTPPPAARGRVGAGAGLPGAVRRVPDAARHAADVPADRPPPRLPRPARLL